MFSVPLGHIRSLTTVVLTRQKGSCATQQPFGGKRFLHRAANVSEGPNGRFTLATAFSEGQNGLFQLAATFSEGLNGRFILTTALSEGLNGLFQQ